MTSWRRLALVALLLLMPSGVSAQAPSQPAPAAAATTDAAGVSSKAWFLVGVGFTSLRGDCQTCEADFPYRRGASLLGGGGYRANRRMDVGAEVLWLPLEYVSGERIHTTHLDAIARFRPWVSRGLVVKGAPESPSSGTGWTCLGRRPSTRRRCRW